MSIPMIITQKTQKTCLENVHFSEHDPALYQQLIEVTRKDEANPIQIMQKRRQNHHKKGSYLIVKAATNKKKKAKKT